MSLSGIYLCVWRVRKGLYVHGHRLSNSAQKKKRSRERKEESVLLLSRETSLDRDSLSIIAMYYITAVGMYHHHHISFLLSAAGFSIENRNKKGDRYRVISRPDSFVLLLDSSSDRYY